MLRSVVRGVGAYLPARVVTNEELSRRLDTSDDWIRERTGIRQRHIAADGELTSDLATAAATAALERAGLAATSIDLILVATSTPDRTFPATAAAVQRKLGAGRGAAFDLQAVCAGFPYALATADALLRAGAATRAPGHRCRDLLAHPRLGGPRHLRPVRRRGRGRRARGRVGAAGSRCRRPEHDRGVLSCFLSADGRLEESLYVDGGPSSTQTTGLLRMNGREVFRHAVAEMAGAAERVLAQAGLATADLDWLVPHQANLRIIDALGRRLGVAPERIVVTVDRHANTSAASIPLALDAAVADGRLRQGQLVCLDGIGGGLAWGAVLLRW
jgi:3-oxoacyl-[acyl-carrier-protein] synthase-3